MGGMVAIPIWGFRERIENVLRRGSQVRKQRAALQSYNSRQMKYRAELRDSLRRIELELYDVKAPKAIQFESWNAFTQPDPRLADINNEPQYDAIQNLSTVLNARNNYVASITTHGEQDDEFLGLNGKCIAMYEKVRETGFLDVALGMTPSPQYNGIMEGDVELDYDVRVLKFSLQSTTKWFEVGLRNSRKMTIQKCQVSNGKVLSLRPDADLAGQYFRIEHMKTLEAIVTATFEVYSGDFVIIFLNKADEGTLTVQLLDRRGKKVGDPYPYALKGGPRNHVEFTRSFF